MIVLITDGNDGETMFRGRSLDEMMRWARENRIPIFMVRVGWRLPQGAVQYDPLWRRAVEQTGGRFFAASDERSFLQAMREIDRLATGRVIERRSAGAAPAFAGFALVAVVLWVTAGAMKLTLPWFRTFP
jgi:hypothetical protein